MTALVSPPPTGPLLRARWWLYSLMVLLACALLGVTGYQLPWTGETPGRLSPVSWALLGVLFLLHLGRRRAPLVVLGGAGSVVLAEAVLTGRSSLAVCVLAGDLLFQAVAEGWSRMLVRCSAAGAGLTMIAVVVAFIGGDLDPRLASVGSVLAVVGVSLWWGRSVHQSREIAEQERELLARTALTERREALVAQRLRISRDLHDAVSGHLSAIALLSESALSADRAGTQRPEVLPAVRTSALQALSEMRSMIALLRGDDTPWAPGRSVPELVRDARASGTTVTAELPTGLDQLPQSVLEVVERGVQEAISNAGRHAPGSAVDLGVTIGPERVTVRMADDGAAGPTDPDARGAGLGLAALTERVTGLGGRVTAGPHGRGWLIEFEIPLSAPGLPRGER